MSTDCYAMVRATGVRLTALTPYGAVTKPTRTASSHSVTTIAVDEFNETASPEFLSTPSGDPRVLIQGEDQTLGFICAISFLRTDPSLIELLTGHPVVKNRAGDIVGIRAETKLPAVAFALEVWSHLVGRADWGYTVFPFLAGGMLTGFEFANGAVSFTVNRAKTRRHPKWAIGPYDLSGWHQRLLESVSGNTAWVNMVTTAQPPVETNGVVTSTDVISNGDATSPHPLRTGSLSGGNAELAGGWTVSGGGA